MLFRSPEYLQINIKTEEDKNFSIIGTRIKTNGPEKDKQKQFDFLNDQIRLIDKVICIGDFNVDNTNANRILNEAKTYGPRTYDDARWSFTHKDGGKVGIDLIATKNIVVLKNQEDDLSKKEGYKMYAKYDWNFVNSKNGYGKLTSSDFLSGVTGKPDHAILTGNIEV